MAKEEEEEQQEPEEEITLQRNFTGRLISCEYSLSVGDEIRRDIRQFLLLGLSKRPLRRFWLTVQAPKRHKRVPQKRYIML